MATDNRAVMVYLPENVEKLMSEYCLAKGITRKGKDGSINPSLGSGILEVLEEYFTRRESNTSDSQSNTSDIESSVKNILPSLIPSNLLTRDELEVKLEELVPRMIEEKVGLLLEK